MPFEEEKKVNQNEWVRWLLNKEHNVELWKILSFWERYRKEWEKMRDEFWNNWYFTSKSIFIDLVLKYEENKKRFIEGWLMEDEREMLESLDGVAKEKFYKEYLYDRILYGDPKSGETHYSTAIPYTWDKTDVKWVLQWIKDIKDKLEPRTSIDLEDCWIWDVLAKTIAEEWKDKLQIWMTIDLSLNDIWEEWVKILAETWKDKLKPEMWISLWHNNIWDEWVKILAETWKDSLQPWMTIDLSNNDISLEWVKILAETWKGKLQPGMKISLCDVIWDEWVKILAETWKDSLQPWMFIDLWQNQIWDEWVKILAETWKDSLQPGMRINLWFNAISDEWVEILVKEWRDRLQPWMKIHLSTNDISNDGKVKLKSLEQSHKDKWINCDVLF